MGKDLATTLNHCERLERLELHFHEDPSPPRVFRNLAAKVTLPRLQSVEFNLLTRSLHDLERFLARHASTLKSCTLSSTDLDSDARSHVFKRFPKFFQDLCEMPALTDLRVDHTMIGNFELCFQSRPYVSCSFEPVEEGYIEVQKDFKTLVLEEVDLKAGVADVLDGMTWVRSKWG